MARIDYKVDYYNAACAVGTENELKRGDDMDGTKRMDIKIGMTVLVVQKQDQRTGKLTEGIVKKCLTNSPTHPHGIKVMLENGTVGRVKGVK